MPYTRTSKSLGFHKDGRKIHTKIPCPLCSGEQGHVTNKLTVDLESNTARFVAGRKWLNCGAFHDKHLKLVE